jgi:hypothetical protein
VADSEYPNKPGFAIDFIDERIKRFRPLHRPNHPKQNRDFH